jgi:hypothetical protein
MHDDTKNKEHASDATSAGRPRPANPSEAEYLKREADDARGAISRTVAEMRGSLKDAGDVRAWARTYPWSTLGVAAAAGFVVAAAFVPRRRRRDDEDAALLERILTDEQIESRLRELAEEDVGRPPREGVLHALVTSLVKTFGPAVQSAVTAAIAARPQQPASPNGEAPAEQSDADSHDATGSAEPPPGPD